MLLVDGVVTRLEERVPVLAQRTKGMLDLSEMMRQKALPAYTPAAFVGHNGITGGAAEFSENAFLQAAEEAVSVVLVQRTAGDVIGSKGQGPLHVLVWDVIYALSGWSPADPDPDDEGDGTTPIGVLVLRRGRTNELRAGTVFYQLDFGLQQQIRVLS